MNLDPEAERRAGEDSPKPADGLRLGVLVGAGGGVVSAIALPLVVLIAGLVTDWVDQSVASALVAFAVWAVAGSLVGVVVGGVAGGAVGLLLGTTRWEAAAPLVGLLLAPLVLSAFTALLSALDQFGDIGSGERIGFFVVVAVFAGIGYLAGRLFRDKLRETS